MPAELEGEAGEMKAEAQDVSNRLFLPKRLEKPIVGSLELEPHPLLLPIYLFTPQTWATPTLIQLWDPGPLHSFPIFRVFLPALWTAPEATDRTGVEMPRGEG